MEPSVLPAITFRTYVLAVLFQVLFRRLKGSPSQVVKVLADPLRGEGSAEYHEYEGTSYAPDMFCDLIQARSKLPEHSTVPDTTPQQAPTFKLSPLGSDTTRAELIPNPSPATVIANSTSRKTHGLTITYLRS